MGIKYEKPVPWGRSFDEYRRMFHLKPEDLDRRIIGCGDGPASFNAAVTAKGGKAVSVDPLYRLSKMEIQTAIEETRDEVLRQTRLNQERFVWDSISSVEELGRIRMSAMEEFLNDYEQGRAEGRYVAGELPFLDFLDNSFDIAICSHFLFLYSDLLDLEFHLAAIAEMCRLATDVRIFPVLDCNGAQSLHMDRIVEAQVAMGRIAQIERVPYEFQRGGHSMLRISRLGD